ncbi:bifunctional 3'-5' exonuclease/DNA polymerase [Clavibacter zhangzhiyongii]|uniref:bifunctional 3'-5' exonuclease/DNA polymerase n=1 Tax=Clavibacter zhangzhiyongii TaxID=2768071 RepID=UPI00195CB117|nr:bifunctional 3'-5' exonuclease/DNA polymerase [Clavibacter zhangzhiyongii]MBM7026364.1 bifunctional 3'-5' exonuclease/DNA polymerase [Clavibacter zhangzhiyongii]
MHILVARTPEGVRLVDLDAAGRVTAERVVASADWPAVAAERERTDPSPRWVWDDTSAWARTLLPAGVRVARCHDLRLCHAILRLSVQSSGSTLARAPLGPWDTGRPAEREPSAAATLFDDLDAPEGRSTEELVAELRLQLEAVAGSTEPGRLRLLLAAESAGALVAAEMSADGLPWDTAVHDALLVDALGGRPAHGGAPPALVRLAARIRELLHAPDLNVDSPPEVLRALRRAGIDAASTRQWELQEIDHPVIPPLLEHKKLSRLLTANGWTWMETWIRDGRFHPEYVPGGVVTGRWAASGGGALQLPRQIRSAVRADPGWRLVVADAAQLEPRVLAALAEDRAMADAGRGTDLYQGLVDAGVVDTRAHAKVAMLGAMYGATSGESGRLMPRLVRAYPKATGYVELAARTGESGGVVSTRLGRASPPPGDAWRDVQQSGRAGAASAADAARARTAARDQGRFTRNFVVQGSAAEWALCWLAGLRRRLAAMERPGSRPHLVFFLHDEVMVHAPDDRVEEVRTAVADAAAEAGRLLFGDAPVDFPVTIAVVDDYAQAK